MPRACREAFRSARFEDLGEIFPLRYLDNLRMIKLESTSFHPPGEPGSTSRLSLFHPRGRVADRARKSRSIRPRHRSSLARKLLFFLPRHLLVLTKRTVLERSLRKNARAFHIISQIFKGIDLGNLVQVEQSLSVMIKILPFGWSSEWLYVNGPSITGPGISDRSRWSWRHRSWGTGHDEWERK